MDTAYANIISLCSGYGGLDIGLHRGLARLGVTARTVCYVEVEAFACANLVKKMEAGGPGGRPLLDAAPIWTDLKTFDGAPFRGVVDIITGGYPCQPFSMAGKRNGTSDPRHLWPYIRGIVETVRPLWCFFENVEGHLSMGYPDVYKDLREMGYAVEAGLFSAAEVGAPHRRNRLFILAKLVNSKSTGRRLNTGGIQQARRCDSGKAQTNRRASASGTNSASTEDVAHAERLGNARRIGGGPQPGQVPNDAEPIGKAWAHPGGDGRRQDEPGRGAQGRTAALGDGEDWGVVSNALNNTRSPFRGQEWAQGGSVPKRGDLWPAPYGARQYEWEPARTVGHAQRPPKDALAPAGRSRDTTGESSQRRFESGVGVLLDGHPRGVDEPGLSDYRVDQLRLLGNGCVPAQVERAFLTLYEAYDR